MLGVSVSTLRRREGDLLQPIVDTDGVHRFAESEVRSVMVTVRHRQTMTAMGPNAGEVAAEVFTLLDEAVHPVDIVKQLKIAPDAITSLHQQWAQMRGGFAVNRDEAKELAYLARSQVPTNARDAVAQLTARAERLLRLNGTSACRFCGEKTACVCEGCVVTVRGPVATLAIALERKLEDSGVEMVRVVATLCWADEVGDEGGSGMDVRSDWFSTEQAARASVRDFLEALTRYQSR